MPQTQENAPVDPTVMDLSDLDLEGSDNSPGDTDDNNFIDPSTVDDDAPLQSTNVEAEAIDMGWAPKDKWRGKPEAWVDAETFVRRGNTILPIVQKDLRSVREENARLKAQVEESRQSSIEFRKYIADQNAARDARVGALLKEERRVALSNQDMDRVNEIDIEMADRRAAPKPADDGGAAARSQQEATRIFEQFTSDNAWAKEERNQRRMSIIGRELRSVGEQRQGIEFMNIVKEEMIARYPGEFRQGGGRAMGEMGGTPGNSTTARRSYENLKPDYKRQADRFFKNDGLPLKDFVANCDADAFRS